MNLKQFQSRFYGSFCAVWLVAFAFLTQSACSGERAKAAHIARGETYLTERKFTEAALEFRSAIEVDKNSAPAHFGLARSYEGQLRLAEAIEELQRTADLDAKHLDARIKLGNYFLLVQPAQIPDAERVLNEIFALDANNVEGHVLKASILTVQNKPEVEILAVLEKAMQINPARAETYLSLARFYLSREKTAEAEKIFARALQVNESSPVVHVEFARFLDATNRAEEAEKHYARAVQLDARNRETLEAFGGFYVAHRQLERAEAIYKQIADLNPDKPEERMVLADFYAAVNRGDDAIRVYQEILSKKPEFVRGRARLGEVLLQRGDRDAANAQVSEILSRNNKDTQGLLLKARIRLLDGEPETAIKDLQEVLKQEPSSRLALYYMADAQLRAGQFEQARNFAGDLQRYHPDFLYGKLLGVQIALAAGETDAALKESNNLLAGLENAAPDQSTSSSALGEIRIGALMARASANAGLGKTDDAKADVAAAQKLAPNSPAVFLNSANAALRTGNLPEAVAFYERVLAANANNFDALSGLTNAKIRQKDFAAAHAKIDRAMTANSGGAKTQAALFYLKAQVFTAERKTAEAENALQKAIQTNADYFPAYLSYASLLVEGNKIDAAIEKYRAVLERNPNDAGTYTIIGLLEDGRGNADAAIDNYRKALQINPNSPIAANNLSWSYAANGKGNLDEAATLMQNLIDKFPAEAGYADTLGWVFYKKGLNDSAIAQLRRAVALDEKANGGNAANPAYRARLGAVLAASGDKINAQRELETALKNPAALSSGERAEAETALQNLRGNS